MQASRGKASKLGSSRKIGALEPVDVDVLESENTIEAA
jgi:hypothetical protein